jgi:hypothetical protein
MVREGAKSNRSTIISKQKKTKRKMKKEEREKERERASERASERTSEKRRCRNTHTEKRSRGHNQSKKNHQTETCTRQCCVTEFRVSGRVDAVSGVCGRVQG